MVKSKLNDYTNEERMRLNSCGSKETLSGYESCKKEVEHRKERRDSSRSGFELIRCLDRSPSLKRYASVASLGRVKIVGGQWIPTTTTDLDVTCYQRAQECVVTCNKRAQERDVTCYQRAQEREVTCYQRNQEHDVTCNPRAQERDVTFNPRAQEHDVMCNHRAQEHDVNCNSRAQYNDPRTKDVWTVNYSGGGDYGPTEEPRSYEQRRARPQKLAEGRSSFKPYSSPSALTSSISHSIRHTSDVTSRSTVSPVRPLVVSDYNLSPRRYVSPSPISGVEDDYLESQQEPLQHAFDPCQYQRLRHDHRHDPRGAVAAVDPTTYPEISSRRTSRQDSSPSSDSTHRGAQYFSPCSDYSYSSVVPSSAGESVRLSRYNGPPTYQSVLGHSAAVDQTGLSRSSHIQSALRRSYMEIRQGTSSVV